MEYIINENTLFIEKNSILEQIFICEEDNKLYLDSSILNIIDSSCLAYGSSYKGRKEYSKKCIRITSKIPIIIKEKPLLIFMPIGKLNIWINFNKIASFDKCGKDVEITFINGITKIIKTSYFSFNNQYLKCCFLYTIFSLKNNKFSFK